MKVRIFAFAAAMAVLCLTADSVFAAQAPRLRIITTTFPLYDWTRQILGKQLQDVELIQLQDNGVDLHNFQPSVRDIARIAQCDLFVFVGGESDEWAETALRSQRNPRRIAVNLLKELGDAAREEEHLETMIIIMTRNMSMMTMIMTRSTITIMTRSMSMTIMMMTTIVNWTNMSGCPFVAPLVSARRSRPNLLSLILSMRRNTRPTARRMSPNWPHWTASTRRWSNRLHERFFCSATAFRSVIWRRIMG